eukprot:2157647-Prorocentrum_lima.AAC.1
MDQQVHYAGVSQVVDLLVPSPGLMLSPGKSEDDEWSSPLKIPSVSPHSGNGCHESCSCRDSWKSRW